MRSSCSVCILSSVFAWGSSVSCLSASSLSLLETGSGVRPVDVCFDLRDAMRGLSRGSAYGTYWPEPNAHCGFSFKISNAKYVKQADPQSCHVCFWIVLDVLCDLGCGAWMKFSWF